MNLPHQGDAALIEPTMRRVQTDEAQQALARFFEAGSDALPQKLEQFVEEHRSHPPTGP